MCQKSWFLLIVILLTACQDDAGVVVGETAVLKDDTLAKIDTSYSTKEIGFLMSNDLFPGESSKMMEYCGW